jgi:hypothetical protein
MIRAECHTADNALAITFDATPWFEEADAPSIVSVARKDWSGIWIAEALESRPGYEELHRLIGYATTHLRDESLEDPSWPTFDCVVNGPDAVAWLRRNRADVAAAVEDHRAHQAGTP